MRTNNISINAYFSHPIRGLKGAAATVADMSLNNDFAALVSKMLSNACPALDLYVPATHDEYVTEAYLNGSHDEKMILTIDKTILARRNIIIAFTYKDVISPGMYVELDFAKQLQIPIFKFAKITEIPELVERVLDWFYTKEV